MSILAVALAHFLKTPNPMMILIIPVVFFAYSDGYVGGALSGAISILYSLYFFSNADKLFTYNELNVQKVLTIVAAVGVIVSLVGKLKAKDAAAILEKEAHVREMTRVNAELDRAVVAAQEASQAKSQFLFHVSHDIRTPMNVILGMTNLAKNEIDDRTIVNDCLEKIATSGHFLLGLINDVLDMSKIESGELKFNEEAYPQLNFKNDILTMFASLCDQKVIKLILDTEYADVPIVMVDNLNPVKL